MCNRACFKGLEGLQHLEGRGQDPDVSIVATNEKVPRARTCAADFVVLEEEYRLAILWFDLGYLEEVECFPL